MCLMQVVGSLHLICYEQNIVLLQHKKKEKDLINTNDIQDKSPGGGQRIPSGKQNVKS